MMRAPRYLCSLDFAHYDLQPERPDDSLFIFGLKSSHSRSTQLPHMSTTAPEHGSALECIHKADKLLNASRAPHLWIALPTALTTCADVLVSRTGGRSQTSCKSKCAALSSSEYESSSSSARDSGRTCKDLDRPGGIACHGVSPPCGQHGYNCQACDSSDQITQHCRNTEDSISMLEGCYR